MIPPHSFGVTIFTGLVGCPPVQISSFTKLRTLKPLDRTQSYGRKSNRTAVKKDDPNSRGFAHVQIRDGKDPKKEENEMVRKRVARRGTRGSRGGFHRFVDPARQLAQRPLVFLCVQARLRQIQNASPERERVRPGINWRIFA